MECSAKNPTLKEKTAKQTTKTKKSQAKTLPKKYDKIVAGAEKVKFAIFLSASRQTSEYGEKKNRDGQRKNKFCCLNHCLRYYILVP